MDVRTKRTIEIWGTIAGFLIVGLIFAWCSSSSKVSNKKANTQANISANANANSIVHETEANSLSNQATAVEAKRVDAARTYKKSAGDTAASKKKFSEAKSDYEKVRNTPVAVDDRDLDTREHQLLTKLRSIN